MTDKHYDIGDTATAEELGLTEYGKTLNFIVRLAPGQTIRDIEKAIAEGRHNDGEAVVTEDWERVRYANPLFDKWKRIR